MLFSKTLLPRSATVIFLLTLSIAAPFAASSLATDCPGAEEADETAAMQISLLQREIHFSKEVMPIDKFDETVAAASLPAAIVDEQTGKVMDKVSSLLLEDAEELQQLLELQKLQQAPAFPAAYRMSHSAADPVMLDDLGGVRSEAETKAADLYAQYLNMKAGQTAWSEETKTMSDAMDSPMSAQEIAVTQKASEYLDAANTRRSRVKEEQKRWVEDVAGSPLVPKDKSWKTFHGTFSPTVGSLIWVALALLAFCILIGLLALLWGMVSSWCFDRGGEREKSLNEDEQKDGLHEVWVRTKEPLSGR